MTQTARPRALLGDGYVRSILADRRAKDDYFASATDSPLRRPDAEQQALSYFPVDER